MQDEYSDDSRIIKNNYGLNFSLDKWNSLKISSPESDFLNYLLEYPTYHSRYDELTKVDFLPYHANVNYFKYWKGHETNFVTSPRKKPKIESMNSTSEIPEKNKLYLQKIIDYSKQQNIPLLLINTPYELEASHQAIYQSVSILAKNENIPYVNFNELYDELKLNFATDFADSHHLNYKGNAKFSSYLGDYIKSNYNVTDRRGDAAYSSYDNNLKTWKEQLYNQELKQISNLDDYLEKLIENENIVSVISVNTDISNELTIRGNSLFKQLGLNSEILNEPSISVVQKNNLLFSKVKSQKFSWSMDFPESSVLNVRQDRISINQTNYLKNNNGINIVSYNQYSNEIVDSITIEKGSKGEIKHVIK